MKYSSGISIPSRSEINAFGIEGAADTYFSKTASTLSLEEAALLVGVLKGPTKYDPVRKPAASKGRRNLVLRRMRTVGNISESAFRRARSTPITLDLAYSDPADDPVPFFTAYVKRKAQEWANSHRLDIYRDGLVIHTSIDLQLQSMAEEAVSRQGDRLQQVENREWAGKSTYGTSASPFGTFWSAHTNVETDMIRRTTRYKKMIGEGLPKTEAIRRLRIDSSFMDSVHVVGSRLGAGLVAIDPGTGQVRAWVGGRSFRQDQYDKVASARRQPGSTFKPFLYAAALNKGFSPYYLVLDRIRTFSTFKPGEHWAPTNAGGGASGQLVSLRQGLARSKNTVSAHLIGRIGARSVAKLATKMGINSPLLAVPSIALGTSEVTLLELTNAYGTLVSNGIRRDPVVITYIEDRTGKTIGDFSSNPKRALSAQTSYTIVDMLRDVVQPGGTGAYIRTKFGLRGDLAGKTGTTQHSADGWFVLMHPDLIVGSWVGFNDSRVVFRSNHWGQGGHNAILLVGDFMRKATTRPSPLIKKRRFRKPKGYKYPVKPIITVPVDATDDLTTSSPPLKRMPSRATSVTYFPPRRLSTSSSFNR